jgi:nitrate/nitrite-specific signal transduction histidine kinase
MGGLRLPRLWRRNLRNRIIAWSFVPSVIILLAVALVTFYAYERVTENLVVQRNREVVRLSAGQLSTSMAEFAGTLETEARKADIYRGVATDQQAELLAAKNRLATFDGGVVLLDTKGVFVTSQPGRAGSPGQDWGDRAFFRDLLRSNQPVYSDITNDGEGGSRVVVVAVPITGEQGEFNGVLAGMFQVGASNVSSFYGNIVKLRIGETGNAFLVDGNGLVIYHPDPARVGTSLSPDPIVQMALAGKVGAERTTDLNGQQVVAGYAPVPGTAWGLITMESWSTLMAPGQGYRRFLLLLLAAGVIVPAIVVWFGVRRITRPIADLTDAAKEVAEGNFCCVVPGSHDEEIENLAEQFNRMSTQLQDSYTLLEQRVADRTRELGTINKITRVVSETLSIDHILENALTELLDIMSFESGVAFRIQPEPSFQIHVVTYRGMPAAWTDVFRAQSEDDWWEWRVIDRPQAWASEAFPAGHMAEMLRDAGVRTIVSVPLSSKGLLLGAISLASQQDRLLSPEELSLLSSVGQQVGVALDNARLYEEAEQAAAAAERSRLARDLHDAVSQTLFSSALIAEVLPKIWEKNPEEGRRRLEELRLLTRGALAEMRALLLELRPAALEQGELSDLLRQLSEAVTGRARVPVTVEVEGQRPLPPDVQVALYRIAQEALNNVAKHARATKVVVNLRMSAERVTLTISDDGVGFTPGEFSPEHLGVGIMRERAEAVGAHLSIRSEESKGTQVVAVWNEPEPAGDPDGTGKGD